MKTCGYLIQLVTTVLNSFVDFSSDAVTVIVTHGGTADGASKRHGMIHLPTVPTMGTI